MFALPLLVAKGKTFIMSVDAKNTQTNLKEKGQNDKLKSDIKYDSGFVDMMAD